MRKLSVFLTVVFFATAVNASVISPTLNAKDIFLPLGNSGKEISLMKLSKIDLKDFQNLTGKKMNFFEKLAVKKLQKKIRKSLNEDGTIRNKHLKELLEKEYMSGGDKSQITAALLAFFLGCLGIHRFYLGYTWQGIVQLLTLGGLGIWALIDFIRILTGSLQPKNGEYAKKM